MSELKSIEENIQSIFAESSYPQDFLDAYDQMECLASHSGRETFLVRGKKSGRTAVAKCYDRAAFPFQLRPDLLQDTEHPGLPRFLEQYRNDRMQCVVREYIEGEPLSDYMKEHPVPLGRIVSFGVQLCDILSVLHGHKPPVIHRDIKPENIIVKPDNTLALIDFDIARFYRENAAGDTVCFGTRGYAPPEQYGFGQTDNRADLYSLGILLRWMVTGSIRENPNVTVDPRLQRVIDRATALSPEDRFADAGQMKQELLKAGNGPRPGWIRNLAAGAALALLMLCCGFALGRFTGWLRPVPGVSFSEPLIEQAVRLQLGGKQGTLTEEDLPQVRCLYIYGDEAYGDPDLFYAQTVDEHAPGPLRTLDDLRLLPGLEEVHIIRQGYLDVSGIDSLTQIHTVEFKHTRLSGVQPVACLTRLRNAVLFDCGLSDVSALEACPWLETLDVGLNHLTDLKEIGSHPSLRSLGLMWLEMENVDEIVMRMPRLQAVTLQHGSVRDLSGLRALPDLKAVYVLPEQKDDVSEQLAGTGAEIYVTEN